VFSSVEIEPSLEGGPRPDGKVPVRVRVTPAKLRTLRLGGGLEFDVLKTAVNGLAGWEHRNFFGGLRVFRVDVGAGVVLYPLRVNNFVAPEKPLPEAKLQLDLRQPAIFGGRTGGFLRPGGSVAPVLLDPNPPEDATVQGYGELRNATGLERTYKRLFGTLAHNLQVAYPFTYIGTKSDTLRTVVVSYPEAVVQVDLRNDRVKPHSGAFFGTTVQVAGLGGDARDVKVVPEARGYLPLGKRTTLAAKVAVGVLLPFNYGSAVYGDPSSLSLEERTFDYQLMYFRGFFSGGPTSNRGYPLRAISPTPTSPISRRSRRRSGSPRCARATAAPPPGGSRSGRPPSSSGSTSSGSSRPPPSATRATSRGSASTSASRTCTCRAASARGTGRRSVHCASTSATASRSTGPRWPGSERA
jgi:hypothetical protein